MNRVRRRRRSCCSAQAVLETALVIPILLLLVCNFVAVMVQVAVQQQLDSATALAAESRFQATQEAYDVAGARCCPGSSAAPLPTAGLPTGCRLAAESFYGTMQGYAAILQWQPGPMCLTGGDSGRAGAAFGGATPYPGSPQQANVSCVLGAVGPDGTPHRGYVDHTLNPPQGLTVVMCSATATIDFSKTPLAWGVLWRPTLSAHAEALPPPFRQ